MRPRHNSVNLWLMVVSIVTVQGHNTIAYSIYAIVGLPIYEYLLPVYEAGPLLHSNGELAAILAMLAATR
jgi:hypothetical protein